VCSSSGYNCGLKFFHNCFLELLMKALFSQFFSAKLYDRLLILLLPIIAVCGALLVGAVLLWLIGANPIEGYKTLVTKATGTASYEEIKIPDPARRELSVKLSRLN